MSELFDTFISYGRADSKVFAAKLHQRLTAQGLKVWFDKEDIPPAVDWQEQIRDGIEKANHFLFIITPYSVQSKYCHQELELAVQYNKHIIPLLHINAEQWLHQTHPIIGQLNWIFCREEQDDWELFITKLFDLLNQYQDYLQQHTELLVKALEWQRHHRQSGYLLINQERLRAQTWLQRQFQEPQLPCLPTDLHCEFICESKKNAHNWMTQVFITNDDSHQELRHKISKTLIREGITIWKDQTEIFNHKTREKLIKEGIEGADNFIYLVSTAANQSPSCQQQLAYALANHKRMILVLVEAIDVTQIPTQLRELKFFDFIAYQDQEKYHASAGQLLTLLRQDALYYEQHKILLVQALKWLQQNHNSSLLLRGYNLQHFQAWLKVAQQRKINPPVKVQIELITHSINQPTAPDLDVFISYSRADSDFARKLNDALQLQGKTTWFDQDSIASGTDFQEEIKRGIRSCDNFVFIISPASVNSPYCADEVEYALGLHKRIVTILYQEVSTQQLHSSLAQVQWIDFRKYGEDFYTNFSELVRTIDTDREHLKNHTKWSQKAFEWQQSQKNRDLLLRGSELSLAEIWWQEAQQTKKQPLPTIWQKEYIQASQAAREHSYQENLRIQGLEREQQAHQLLDEVKHQVNQELAKRSWLQWREIPTPLIITTIIMLLRLTGAMQFLDLLTFDFMFLLRPTEPVDERITIVEVDEETLTQAGSWPLSDRLIAQLLRQIDNSQPLAIGLDIYRDLPVPPGQEEFITAASTIPNLIGIEKLEDQSYSGTPPSPILKAKDQVGFNNVPVDFDGKVRRLLLYWHVDGQPRSSLALKLALLYLEQQGVTPQTAKINSDYLQLGQAVFPRFQANDGGYINADAGAYQVLANFRSASSFKRVKMQEVLAGQVEPSLIRGKIVLIGTTAPSLKNHFYIPHSRSLIGNSQPIDGVELQAHFVSNILSAALDKRPLIQVVPEKGEWLYTLAWSVLGALIGSMLLQINRLKNLPLISIVAGAVILVLIVGETTIFGIAYVAFLQGLWLPVIPPWLAFLGATTITPLVINAKLEKSRLRLTMKLIMATSHASPDVAHIAIEYLKNSETSQNQIFLSKLPKDSSANNHQA